MRRIIVGFLLLIMFFAGSTLASTWHVEKDGSGDFTVIQDAVDICASGDTIMVGPGWFEEYQLHSFSNGGAAYVYVYKKLPDLAIIGAGCDETFIGSSKDGTWGAGDHCCGVLVMPNCNAGELILENLTVAGVTKGIELSQGSLEMSHCVVSDCYVGINSVCPISVSSCEFRRIQNYGLKTFSVSEKVIAADCRFVNCGGGFYFGSSLDVLVKNCEFVECRSGGSFYFSSGEMYNCKITDALYSGISFFGPGEFRLYDNEISSGRCNMNVGMAANNLLCENNSFSGTSYQCITITSCEPVFHNNDILKESGYSVFLDGYLYDTEHVDMTNNYWGTDDPDSLAVWIHDANDTYVHPMYGYVDFSPFSGESVPTEETTWDALKAMFR